MNGLARLVCMGAMALLFGCSATRNGGGGSVQLTASGEVLALGGYAFPPAQMGDPAFVDGWEIQFTKVIAVFDKITLSEAPDSSPSDPTLIGKLVAEADGPWAIDLHRGGPLPGMSSADEQAYPIVVIANQNQNGGAAFDPTVRYAFGFDSVAATDGARLLQVDAKDPDWQAMIANHWNVLYVGIATWKGGAAGVTCRTTNPSYDFSKLPTIVNFRLGFATPATYVNCQNPANDPARGLGGENHERGVQVRPNDQALAQVTFHTDHPFWESFTHDTPLHFDPLAAAAVKDANGKYTVTLDDVAGVDYQAFKDRAGNPLPWRACDAQYVPRDSSAQMGFDSLSIPYNPMGDPTKVIRDYRDYARYNQSTQGHLNSDGLCAVQRHYPSPQ